jgi:HAL2 family 3'(2'),5'-bisphosphate nucleotidase
MYQQELKVALDVVKMASMLCSKVQKALAGVETMEKTDRSPVTIADFGSQAVINLEIIQSFPGDQIVGEEDADLLRGDVDTRRQVVDLVNEQIAHSKESRILEAIDFGVRQTDFTQRFWTVDPIDGTKGFLRGEQYAVALALVENGKVTLGVLGCPNYSMELQEKDDTTGYIFYAVKGEGAYVRSLDENSAKSISVDDILDAKEARICESVERAHVLHDTHASISSALGITSPPYRMDSQAKYAVVASGGASIYLRLPGTRGYKEKIWDHAAGSIILDEAGGQVTDFSGKSLDFSKGKTLENNVGILATNGHLHQEVLRAISDVRRHKTGTS